jgi:HK97 family phage major capsid protein
VRATLATINHFVDLSHTAALHLGYGAHRAAANALLTMSDSLGRPPLQSVQGLHDGPRWSLLGFPIYIASQMANVAPDCIR